MSFNGFPARMQFTSIPNLFFSSLLPQISDILELKLTLYAFAAIYRKKGALRYTTYGELMSDASLMKSFSQSGKTLEEALRKALGMATERGTLLHIALDRDGVNEDIYFLNTEANKELIARIQSGEVALTGLKPATQAVPVVEPSDIYNLYEQNIGMLTPMIADELRDAEKHYPAEWVKDAIKEAVALNRRNWRYIARILERWSTEGKVDGAYRGNSQKTDPDRFIKGKYGHVVRRS